MAMTKVEATGGSCGERGTVKFTPNARARDTNNLRLIQITAIRSPADATTGFTLVANRVRPSRRNHQARASTLLGPANAVQAVGPEHALDLLGIHASAPPAADRSAISRGCSPAVADRANRRARRTR
jgi:hypothetical protein